mmetsp:Transcript_8147/g.20420  ORF Transcript_8147/g.20420 Transcript_8147/m.20420 type:complete len:202 (-) Transcript_8147:1906-2511(-)
MGHHRPRFYRQHGSRRDRPFRLHLLQGPVPHEPENLRRTCWPFPVSLPCGPRLVPRERGVFARPRDVRLPESPEVHLEGLAHVARTLGHRDRLRRRRRPALPLLALERELRGSFVGRRRHASCRFVVFRRRAKLRDAGAEYPAQYANLAPPRFLRRDLGQHCSMVGDDLSRNADVLLLGEEALDPVRCDSGSLWPPVLADD